MKAQQKKRKWTEDKEWVEKRAKNKGLVKKYGGGGWAGVERGLIKNTWPTPSLRHTND